MRCRSRCATFCPISLNKERGVVIRLHPSIVFIIKIHFDLLRLILWTCFLITYFSILFFMSFPFYRERRSFWTLHLAFNSFYIQLLFCSHWFVPPFIFQPFYILKWTRTIYFLKYKWLMGYPFFFLEISLCLWKIRRKPSTNR